MPSDQPAAPSTQGEKKRGEAFFTHGRTYTLKKYNIILEPTTMVGGHSLGTTTFRGGVNAIVRHDLPSLSDTVLGSGPNSSSTAQ